MLTHLLELTKAILPFPLDSRIVDISLNLEVLQMIAQALEFCLLGTLATLVFLCRHSFHRLDPLMRLLYLLKLYRSVRSQHFSRFLETVVWQLLEWDACCLAHRSSPSPRSHELDAPLL